MSARFLSSKHLQGAHGLLGTPARPLSPSNSQLVRRQLLPACSPNTVTVQKLRAFRETDTPLIQLIVGGLTEGIRIATGGKATIDQQPLVNSPVAAGDLDGMLQALKEDWELNKYYITGVISDAIYDPDCSFSDPTIAFKGVDTWKRNMALVVPFQEDPSIDLLSLEPLPQETPDSPPLVQADWWLATHITLPWRPLITLRGRTTYTLNKDLNKVVKHTESWSISGNEALSQLFKPTERSQLPFLRPKSRVEQPTQR